jgi:hypothetical protein
MATPKSATKPGGIVGRRGQILRDGSNLPRRCTTTQTLSGRPGRPRRRFRQRIVPRPLTLIDSFSPRVLSLVASPPQLTRAANPGKSSSNNDLQHPRPSAPRVSSWPPVETGAQSA